MSFPKRLRWAAVAAGTALVVGGVLLGALGPNAVLASSHREAPLTAADPQIDATDLYAFRSPDKPSTVTFVSNWIPFEEPAGGPNFYLWAPNVRYDINIDNNGDAKPDIIYRWVFTTHFRTPGSFLYNTGVVNHINDPTLNIFQTYDLYRIKGDNTVKLLNDAPAAPSDVGQASMPDYATLESEAIKHFGANNASTTLAGQADDPFFLDLRVFDLVYGCSPTGSGCADSTGFTETGHDTLKGFNVNTLVLQVPRGQVQGSSSSIIGVWTTAERQSTRVQRSNGTVSSSGDFVQVSRLGMPLVNEVVVPIKLKDFFNGSKPVNDAQFLPAVQDPELPHDVNALYGLSVPDSDPGTAGIQRSDLISVFLTGLSGLNQPPNVRPSEMLRVNLATPLCGVGGAPACNPIGVIGGDPQGFPNGRRLSDDTIDVALRVTEGCLLNQNTPTSCQLSDGVDNNDVAFRTQFPYVALPHSGSDATPHA
jgi:Domain of unknown function (DUF4331)